MEKEMKKLLLVAVSVGVFLLVTITAAVVVLTPKIHTEETAFSSSRPHPARIEAPVVQAPSETVREVAVISNNEVPINSIAADRSDGDSLTINIPKPTTAAVPDTPVVQTSNSRPVAAITPSNSANSSATGTTAAARPAASSSTSSSSTSTSSTRPSAMKR